ncbi:hypothetical protein EX895_004691 [Sporisorium graminicola]|uniref:RFX-type winged-helix domain-containing protein n=1 Tax=Sporisorium graminicola TaxID=280036 RepID=A0A4U7KU88_9BASI|nr:hypothetical protein EX895_004691 [Sporisorium graminicola]TKY86542.1 hypothetical protein EX895_004691 [Sporisorium graminicola]
MSAPYYSGQASTSSDSPYRPGTADSVWEQSRSSSMGEARPDLFAHTTTGAAPSSSSSSHFRPEPLLPSQSSAIGGSQAGVYFGANVVTPRQTAFPRDQIDAGAHFSTPGVMDSFDHGVQAMVPTETPRAAHFGGGSSALVGTPHTFAAPTSSAWPSTVQQQQQQQQQQHQHQQHPQQQQSESMAYNRYAYPSQGSSSSWASPAGLSMSQSIVYDSSSSANTSPNRSQTYYDMPKEQFDHTGYASHMGSHNYPMYGTSTSKMGPSSAYISAPQPEYPPEEIDSMLNQVSTLYKTANTKKMAEFHRDKWARVWLNCNYTLKPSIQISIPRTILHESYRRACDSFGLEPLQAASFGKVLRSQFPDVAQRRLGGRGKTRFHYCGFGTSNEREALKVKSLLEDEKAGKLQLSAGLSAEYAAEARASSRSETHDGESSSSYRTQTSSEASSSGEGPSSSRVVQYTNSPHTSSESGGLGHSGIATDDRLIASAFATLNSAVLTPPGTSSGTTYGGPDAGRHPQVPSQGHANVSHSTNVGGATIPRRHTVSHSYSGLGDFSLLSGMHTTSETADAGVLHPSGDVSIFGPGTASGVSESAQSTSLLNSPASSLHGYQYLQDPRHMPTSIPFRRSCQDLPDWPTLPEQHGNTTLPNTMASSSSSTYVSGGASTSKSASYETTRKAWREYESLCQALLYSIYLGPDLVSFVQRTSLFWTSLSASTLGALRGDGVLHGMILRADGIIFRQLLAKLDGMIGDDVPEEGVVGLQSLASMLSDQIGGLVDDVLPEACKLAKVQASGNVAESLQQVAEIFEAIKKFREAWMLDGNAGPLSDWHSSDAGHRSARAVSQSARPTSSSLSSSSSAGRGTRSSLSLSLRNRSLRPRSGTQSSINSLPGPLADLQLRHRVHSVNSTLSDSQTHSADGVGDLSSSQCRLPPAFESSELSTFQGMSNEFVAPLSRGEPRLRMASNASGEINLELGSLALAMPPCYRAPVQSAGDSNSDGSQQPLKVERRD